MASFRKELSLSLLSLHSLPVVKVLVIMNRFIHQMCFKKCLLSKLFPLNIIRITEDFSGGTVVKNPFANAGDTGSIPSLGKIPHAAEQLSPCATTTEPAL